MRNTVKYCTYFNKNYLLKGLALHSTLLENEPGAKLDILCLDEYTYDLLAKMKLKGASLIRLSQIEDKKLLLAKNNRSQVEYYWTLTPSFTLYVLNNSPSYLHIVYLDCDLCFFSNPKKIFSEIGEQSLLITEHRYPKNLEYCNKILGRFNVGLIIFKNNDTGKICLSRWRSQCLNWCYNVAKDGKFGDQMYLNEWPTIYQDLVISENLGVNIGPWNINNYRIRKKHQKVHINNHPLIAYHFHQFAIKGYKKYTPAYGYKLSKDAIRFIYKPYQALLSRLWDRVLSYDKNFFMSYTANTPKSFISSLISRYLSSPYWYIRGKLKW